MPTRYDRVAAATPVISVTLDDRTVARTIGVFSASPSGSPRSMPRESARTLATVRQGAPSASETAEATALTWTSNICLHKSYMSV